MPYRKTCPNLPEAPVESGGYPVPPAASDAAQPAPSPAEVDRIAAEQPAPSPAETPVETTPVPERGPGATPRAAALGKGALAWLPSTSSPIPTPSPSGAELLAEGRHYLDAKDYAQALPPIQKAADAGDADATNYLAWLYWNGWGVTQDYRQTRQWYQKAAAAGNPIAMSNLGLLYQHGLGVTQDYAQAAQWYQKAADAGNAQAMNNLGFLYEKGWGVTQDYRQTRQWYQKAAAAGNPIAVDKLAVLDRGAQDSKRLKTTPPPARQVQSNRSPTRARSSNAGDPGKTEWSGIPKWLNDRL
jgi:TPR repeat protein